jgi:hypothetical protein
MQELTDIDKAFILGWVQRANPDLYAEALAAAEAANARIAERRKARETSETAALAAQCEEPHPGQGGLICTRPASHGGGHKDERNDVYWPRHDGGSEDLDAALTPPGYSLPAGELASEDLSAAADDAEMCEAIHRDERMTCTRPVDHTGRHAAHGIDDQPLVAWPQTSAKADAR